MSTRFQRLNARPFAAQSVPAAFHRFSFQFLKSPRSIHPSSFFLLPSGKKTLRAFRHGALFFFYLCER
jgi:hypothetical protein